MPPQMLKVAMKIIPNEQCQDAYRDNTIGGVTDGNFLYNYS